MKGHLIFSNDVYKKCLLLTPAKLQAFKGLNTQDITYMIIFGIHYKPLDMKSKIQLGKALCLFLVMLMNFSVGGYVYGFQEYRSPVKIELVGSQASIKRSNCYYFTRYQSKRTIVVPITNWENYLRYVETRMIFCHKNSIWMFENLPKIKFYAYNRCFDFDNDYLLNDAALPWCNITCIQQKSIIKKEHYENIIL